MSSRTSRSVLAHASDGTESRHTTVRFHKYSFSCYTSLMSETQPKIVIEVRRAESIRPGRRLQFTYSWKTIADEDFRRPDGTTYHRPAGTWTEHGTSAMSLYSMLSRKHGKGIVISRAWEATPLKPGDRVEVIVPGSPHEGEPGVITEVTHISGITRYGTQLTRYLDPFVIHFLPESLKLAEAAK